MPFDMFRSVVGYRRWCIVILKTCCFITKELLLLFEIGYDVHEFTSVHIMINRVHHYCIKITWHSVWIF